VRAARYLAPGEVDLIEAPLPAAAPGQVVVRVSCVTLCGSDLHELTDGPRASYPRPPGFSGHECVGVVEESSAPGVRRGDRTLVITPRHDALAEYLAVEPQGLIPLPAHVEMDQGVLAQQLGTVIYCCRKLDNVLDKTVVVIGQGPAGLLFTILLARMGAKAVIGLDVVEDRLEMARQVGATHTVNALQEDVIATVGALTGGRMADLAVEVVGKEETVNLGPDLVRVHGELALFGVAKRSVFPFAYEKFMRRQLRTISSAHTLEEPGLRSFRLAMDLIARGFLDGAPLVTHRLPFSEVRQAFRLAESKQDGAIKVLLNVDDGASAR
jgi:L-iditol 2-dehydrogenase